MPMPGTLKQLYKMHLFVKPKKSFGQHFLHDESVARAIAESLTGFGGYRNLLEIGPGTGVLTKYLIANPNVVWHGIELDRDSVAFLHAHYPEISDRLTQADFLRESLLGYAKGEQLAIIGNFPYNISSQIVFKIIENKEWVPEMVGMFQKEMAMRIAAPHGSKTYGVTSVLTQAFYKVEYLFSVDAQVFTPPPKVQSGVLRFTRKEGALPCEQSKLFAVVKTAFNQRRKTLRNSLAALQVAWHALPQDFPGKRPEQLSLEDFFLLAQNF